MMANLTATIIQRPGLVLVGLAAPLAAAFISASSSVPCSSSVMFKLEKLEGNRIEVEIEGREADN